MLSVVSDETAFHDVEQHNVSAAKPASTFSWDRDKRVAYAVYFCLGAGALMPWNAFITAVDYFAALYPRAHVDRLFSVAYMPANLITLTLAMRAHTHLTPHRRIVAAFIGFTATMLCMPLLDIVLLRHAQHAPQVLLIVTVACVVCNGVCDGLGQGALYGDAALLPEHFTQAVTAGTAASGCLVSLLRIATKALTHDSVAGLRVSAQLYFALSAAFTAACIAAYSIWLPTLPFVRNARHALKAQHKQSEPMLCAAPDGCLDGCAAHARPHACANAGLHASSSQTAVNAAHCCVMRNDCSSVRIGTNSGEAVHWHDGSCDADHGRHYERSAAVATAAHRDGVAHMMKRGCSQRMGTTEGTGDDAESPTAGLLQQHGGLSCMSGASHMDAASIAALDEKSAAMSGVAFAVPFVDVFKKVWKLAMSLMVTYIITLSIFPGMLTEDVRSVRLGDWYPILLIACFNVADFCGKLAPAAFVAWPINRVLTTSLLRVVFLPLFAAAAHYNAQLWIIVVLTLMLGLTNGFQTTVAFMKAACEVGAVHADVVGNIMVWWLVVGLTVGACCGWLWLL